MSFKKIIANAKQGEVAVVVSKTGSQYAFDIPQLKVSGVGFKSEKIALASAEQLIRELVSN